MEVNYKKALCLVLSLVFLLPLTGVLQTDAAAEPPPDTVAEPPADAAVEPSADDAISSIEEYAANMGMVIYEIEDHDSKYQLSGEQLAAPTEELVEAVISCPCLCELLLSSTLREDTPCPAYDSVRMIFNGLVELEKRTDASSVMLAKLNELVSNPDQLEGLAWKDAHFLEILLSVPVYREKLTENETIAYIQSCDTYHSLRAEQVLLEESATAETLSGEVDSFTLNGRTHTFASTTSTTSGTPVPLYATDNDYTSAGERQLYENYFVDVFGVKLLGNATTKYNCRSYAWYDTSTSNTFWIGYDGSEVKLYTDDKHCTGTSSPSVGSIVVYYNYAGNPVHSAVVTSISGSTIMCKSKWGQSGLYEHKPENVPDDYLNNGILDCEYYTYTTRHTNAITINDTSTHTKTCNICGWTSTEAHVEDPSSGRCVTCGLMGPFASIITNVPCLPEDE